MSGSKPAQPVHHTVMTATNTRTARSRPEGE
jgi:hypothetical protein